VHPASEPLGDLPAEPAPGTGDNGDVGHGARYHPRVSFDVVIAADLDWGIGKDQGLPWPRLRQDMRHFARVTTGDGTNAIVMGRKTWESKEVDRKPLPKRRNVVVSRGAYEVPEGVVAVRTLDESLAVPATTTFVVGGAGLLREGLAHPALRYIYLTRIEGRYGCDIVLPDLYEQFARDAWDGEQELEDNGVKYRIQRLKRR
jgi:dihydrofolate reductase